MLSLLAFQVKGAVQANQSLTISKHVGVCTLCHRNIPPCFVSKVTVRRCSTSDMSEGGAVVTQFVQQPELYCLLPVVYNTLLKSCSEFVKPRRPGHVCEATYTFPGKYVQSVIAQCRKQVQGGSISTVVVLDVEPVGVSSERGSASESISDNFQACRCVYLVPSKYSTLFCEQSYCQEVFNE